MSDKNNQVTLINLLLETSKDSVSIIKEIGDLNNQNIEENELTKSIIKNMEILMFNIRLMAAKENSDFLNTLLTPIKDINDAIKSISENSEINNKQLTKKIKEMTQKTEIIVETTKELTNEN